MQNAAETTELPENKQHTVLKLFLVSFATLFFEVLMIRWLASEIRVFAFFKNLSLMACVLGMGLGCATQTTAAKKTVPYILWFTALITVLSAILAFAPKLGLTNMSFVITPDIFDWQFAVPSITALFANVVGLLCMFLLVVGTFELLGRELGRNIAQHSPLKAYGINLLGSLTGVVAYSAACFLGTSPLVWLSVGFLSLACFQTKKQLIPFALLVLTTLGFTWFTVGDSIWSPYYRIDLSPLNTYTTADSVITTPYQVGTAIDVNHMRHQRTFDLAESFLSQHPELKTGKEYLAYNLPYAANSHPHEVLVLGAGSGNDVAAALRHDASHVDAVEIDPAIYATGVKVHPEHPYQDPRVSIHINDARVFLGKSDSKNYDLIVFGHLDSHTAFSVVSSVRLDNYLYTRESLELATKHLAPNGVASLSFSAQPAWLRARLYQLVKSVSGNCEPLSLMTGFDGKHSILIFWGPGLDAVRSSIESRYKDMVIPVADLSTPVEPPTDDWPFLYQLNRDVPPVYIAMLATVLMVAGYLVVMRFRLNAGAFVSYSQFFFLGAGFLLLETRAMLAIAVLFGSTWIVNSIVIGTVLLMALLANYVVYKTKFLTESRGYLGLMIALAMLYMVPLSSLAGGSWLFKAVAGTALVGLPFIFTGIVFSRAFSKVEKPEMALGINILGAILGGCLEYLSTVTGVGGLTLIAIAIYGLSWLASRLKQSTQAASPSG